VRGAALVLALLTVSFAAVIASAALADFGHSLEEVAARDDRAHARQLALAGVDWARHVLADDARTSAVDHPGEPWAMRIPPTPISGDATEGTIAGHIEDLSGRFNLNALAPASDPQGEHRARLARLIAHGGIDGARATALAAAVATELSARAPVMFADPLELRLLPGFDEALVARLTPWVAALPPPTRINVNSAPPEVLAAIVDGLAPQAARTLIAARGRGWWRNGGDFAASLPDGATRPPARLVDVRSRHFLITVHAARGVAVTRLEALVEREQAWPTLLHTRSP
jgi:general secretion pathway protein K